MQQHFLQHMKHINGNYGYFLAIFTLLFWTFRGKVVLLYQITNEMRKTVILLLLLLLFITGCNQNSLKQQLVEIDSISTHKDNKKALELLDKITPETIEDEECLAYYWTLRIRSEARLSIKIQSVEPANICIQCYKKTGDKAKLGRAYFDKAYILMSLNDNKNAYLALKEAEALIKDNDKEIELASIIYHNLAVISYKANEEELFLTYSKLALKKAYQSKKQVEIAHSLLELFGAYRKVGNMDSARYYLNKCIPLIEQVPDKNKVSFYNNIGMFMLDKDIHQAEDYFNKALAITPDVFTFRGLAHVYIKKGERAKAEEMWEKALLTDNLYLKAEILQARYDCQREEGDYKTACETAIQIAAVKDTIARKQREEDIRGLQERFEQERQAEADRQQYVTYISVAATLLFLLLAATLYLYYRNVKGKKQFEETQQMLEKYRTQLKAMQQEGKADAKEVERLTQKISDLQKKQNALLQNGHERFNEIKAGGTTLRWNRNDFTDCVEYFRTQDAAFVAHMETGYYHLSSKYIFFAIMEHLGKNDEELQHIMVVSQNTIRSIRSRINGKLKDKSD